MKLGELASRLGAELRGIPDLEVTGVKGIEEAGPSEITFVANPKYAGLARKTKAAAVLVEPEFPEIEAATIRVKNPYHAFSRALGMFYQAPAYAPGIHATAVVDPSAEVGDGSHIGAYVVIGPNVRLGPGATLLPHVVLYPGVKAGKRLFAHAHAVVRENCELGDDVTLENGAIVGADGTQHAAFLAPNADGAGFHEVDVAAPPPAVAAAPAPPPAPAPEKVYNLNLEPYYLPIGPHWKNQFTLGVVNTTGNTEETSFATEVNFHYNEKPQEFTLKIGGVYDTTDGKQTAGQAYLDAVYRRILPEWDKSERWYVFGENHELYDGIKEISYRMRLERIADGRRGAMRVDVANVRGIDLGIANRIAHYAEAAFVLRRGLRDVVGVSRHAVADNFRNRLGAASACMLQFFENKNS